MVAASCCGRDFSATVTGKLVVVDGNTDGGKYGALLKENLEAAKHFRLGWSFTLHYDNGANHRARATTPFFPMHIHALELKDPASFLNYVHLRTCSIELMLSDICSS